MDIKRITRDSDNICQSESGIVECKNGNIYEIPITTLEKIFDIIDEPTKNLDVLPRILRVVYHENCPLLASRHSLLTRESYELTCIRCRYNVVIC